MEKQRCKLCFKSFANGRALGGHMRSHMMNLYVPPKPEQQIRENPSPNFDDREERETDFASSSSSDEEKGFYGLRENPKKSIRLVDPEFSFRSVVLQDRESETESSKNPIRRRSNRIRKSGISLREPPPPPEKRPKPGKMRKPGSPEPVSSISDTTSEEDVAYCLMMLSRDKWMREPEPEPEPDEDNQTDFSGEFKNRKSNRVRGKYKCETCHKVFRSYQALGGHRASHKKIRLGSHAVELTREVTSSPVVAVVETRNGGEEKIHECPVCLRVFSSGQALGGHKRSHVIGSSSTTIATTTIISPKPLSKFVDTFIDLNLPAPMDDDDEEISQIELSAVSDAEFVNPFKH